MQHLALGALGSCGLLQPVPFALARTTSVKIVLFLPSACVDDTWQPMRISKPEKSQNCSDSEDSSDSQPSSTVEAEDVDSHGKS